ncbi:hypothetical protein C8J23_1253 [Shewanella chilikensis]|uniref:Transposase n=1 Tax=Shewanella chilikensis TaxID=558541 RepID=A0ABX5PKS0_9GAMM|nr:hypothetical protein C8J23_1253 [Shewanella chilikensis]
MVQRNFCGLAMGHSTLKRLLQLGKVSLSPGQKQNLFQTGRNGIWIHKLLNS